MPGFDRGALPGGEAVPVTIIVRTLGRRRSWLQGTLRSIDRQRYGAVEIVLIEDGPGALAELARDFPLQAGRRLRYRHQAELGMAKAGNLGLAFATGRYAGLLDDDDELEPDHIKLLAAALEAREDWGAVVARALWVPVRSTAQDEGWPAAGAVVGPTKVSYAMMHLANQLPISAVLVRTELLRRVGGFDPALVYLEDWDLWLRCLALMPFGTVDAVTSRQRVPGTRRGREHRAALHAPWRERVLQKLAASDGAVASRDVITAFAELRDHVDAYVPANRLVAALLRRAWTVLRGRPL